ncbi:MAG: xanthine phosphoribosyltransferase [Clostridia bacterium]|nr:xanthine phosphoribosyltransferase [Clostridia bacterium]
MKALEERILKDGEVLPGHILKVNRFLNHQVDVAFTMEMGEEIARLFKEDRVDKVLTIETSGIPVAFAAAAALKVPMVFAKKNKTSNVNEDVYRATVHSYTHNRDYDVVVSKDVLGAERVLIIDDFLANGCALRGLMEIIGQAGGETVGCVTAIEKGFQGGGDGLRKEGIKVESLAIIDEMTDDALKFRR